MHVFPSMLIGFAVWIAVIISASVKLYALGAGPLIVSAVALAACAAPVLRLPRPRHPAASAPPGG